MNTDGAAASEILVEVSEGVAVITLNRPERLNALVSSMMADLADAIADAARDEGVGCVVITGAGRAFCAGGDLRDGGERAQVSREGGGWIEQSFVRLRGFTETSRLLHDMPKPTIAMVNGPVAGAGIGIAGACDLRFAAESASFLSAFDRIGASGDFGSTWFWTKILGVAGARELFLLGEKLSAAQALAKGIYTRVHADDALRDSTLSVARGLADGPRVGWRYMKANLNFAEDGSFEAALDHEAMNMGLSIQAVASIKKARHQADG